METNKVFLKLQGEWYISDRNTMSPRTTHLFDAIVFRNQKGFYEIAKDRLNELDPSTFDMLRMELFLEGKTLAELNTFSIDESSRAPNGPLSLHRVDSGDLVAYKQLDAYTL